MNKGVFYAWIAFLCLLVLNGFYNFYIQTVDGHILTGMSDQVPWGIYIAAFAFFVGASAGSTVVASLIYGFGLRGYKPIGRRAGLVTILCVTAAVTFILVDVGRLPQTMLVPWVNRNMTSMFNYTSLSYIAFSAIVLAELYFVMRADVAKISLDSSGIKRLFYRIIALGSTNLSREKIELDKKLTKVLAIIAFPFALWILHAPHGSIFANIKAREYWHTPLLPPYFAVSALVSGAAIMILLTIVTSKINKRELLSKETLDHFGKLLAFFITVDIFFEFFDITTLLYAHKPAAMEAWHIVTGRYTSVFLLQTMGMVIALGILLFKQGRTTIGLTVASILSISAVAAFRWNLVVGGILPPLMPGFPAPQYTPTGVEISVTVGIVALIMLLYAVSSKVLPIEEPMET